MTPIPPYVIDRICEQLREQLTRCGDILHQGYHEHQVEFRGVECNETEVEMLVRWRDGLVELSIVTKQERIEDATI